MIVAKNPGVLQDLVNFDPRQAVFDQELRDQVLSRGADIGPDRVIKRDLLVDCLAPDFFIILTVKWKVPPEH